MFLFGGIQIILLSHGCKPGITGLFRVTLSGDAVHSGVLPFMDVNEEWDAVLSQDREEEIRRFTVCGIAPSIGLWELISYRVVLALALA